MSIAWKIIQPIKHCGHCGLKCGTQNPATFRILKPPLMGQFLSNLVCRYLDLTIRSRWFWRIQSHHAREKPEVFQGLLEVGILDRPLHAFVNTLPETTPPSSILSLVNSPFLCFREGYIIILLHIISYHIISYHILSWENLQKITLPPWPLLPRWWWILGLEKLEDSNDASLGNGHFVGALLVGSQLHRCWKGSVGG